MDGEAGGKQAIVGDGLAGNVEGVWVCNSWAAIAILLRFCMSKAVYTFLRFHTQREWVAGGSLEGLCCQLL